MATLLSGKVHLNPKTVDQLFKYLSIYGFAQIFRRITREKTAKSFPRITVIIGNFKYFNIRFFTTSISVGGTGMSF